MMAKIKKWLFAKTEEQKRKYCIEKALLSNQFDSNTINNATEIYEFIYKEQA
jgi:hypothetical protein